MIRKVGSKLFSKQLNIIKNKFCFSEIKVNESLQEKQMKTKSDSKLQQQAENKNQQFDLDNYLKQFSNQKIEKYSDAKLAYNLGGLPIPEKINKKLDNMILSQITDKKGFLEFLSQKIMQYLTSLSLNDEKFPSLELNFHINQSRAAHILQKNGFKIKYIKDESNFSAKNLSEQLNIFEITHIIGLNQQRGLNLPTQSYQVDRTYENQGILKFVHRHAKQLPNEDKPDMVDYRNASKQMIIRIHVEIVSPYRLSIMDKNVDIGANTNFRHVAIFENQLRLPPKLSKLSFKDELDWFKLYRLQNDWVLVDFDKFMNGNPLLKSQFSKQELFVL